MAILFGDNYCQAKFQVQKGIKYRNYVVSVQKCHKLVVVDTFTEDSTMISDVPDTRTSLRASNYKET